jgi:hypothetical protein
MSKVPSFSQYLVEETREVFFTFGRMNPPTIGHGKLMNVMSAKAGKNPYKVYLSQSSDPRKNPLTYEQKIKHSRKMYPKHARSIIKDKKLRNVFEVASSLYDQGFNRITMVVGADRITEFETLLNKYNGVKGRHGFYNFEKINVVSAGDRDPDAEGVEGMSASKQRENAKNNDFTTFSQGIPSSMSNKDAKRLFNDVRAGMGLKETTQFKNHIALESVSETREKFIEGELFNEGDEVFIKSSGKSGHIHRLGANYVIVALDEGRISREWLDNVEKIDEAGFGNSRSVFHDLMPNLDNFLDRFGGGRKRWKYAIQQYQRLDKENPKANLNTKAYKAAQIADVDVRGLRDLIQKMQKEETYSPQKHEWGTDAATKWAKSMTPGETVKEADDELSAVRRSIEKEKDQDKKKHDRMLDRARLARARRKNKETRPTQESKGNPVAKNLNKFNKPATHKDKKKDDKRGYLKHKGNLDG